MVITVGELHVRGVIFRDLKPANVLFDAGGHIKVVDFGLAKILDDHQTNTICGTLCYQAPEIILGKTYGYPVDWWALGVVIFELQSKDLPFGCGDPFSLQQNILALSIVWPRKPKIISKLKDLIRQMIKMNPSKRVSREKALQHVFLKFLNMDGIQKRIVRPPYQPAVSSTTDTSLFTSNKQPKSPFPPLAQKEKVAWNQELQNLMLEEEQDSKDFDPMVKFSSKK
jgi:serine/threonine protein kinase